MRLVPLRVVFIVGFVSVVLTAYAMLWMFDGGYQMGLARNVAEYQEALVDSAMTLVGSAGATVRCYLGDCP